MDDQLLTELGELDKECGRQQEMCIAAEAEVERLGHIIEAQKRTAVHQAGVITELKAECAKLRGALEALVKDCPDCGGEGTVYLMADETEIGQSPGSSGQDCRRCAEARKCASDMVHWMKEQDDG